MGKIYYRFDIVDYVVFAAMLLISTITGLYYGCRSRYCKTAEAPNLRDYLTGSKSMKPFPVAMSLVARAALPIKARWIAARQRKALEGTAGGR